MIEELNLRLLRNNSSLWLNSYMNLNLKWTSCLQVRCAQEMFTLLFLRPPWVMLSFSNWLIFIGWENFCFVDTKRIVKICGKTSKLSGLWLLYDEFPDYDFLSYLRRVDVVRFSPDLALDQLCSFCFGFRSQRFIVCTEALSTLFYNKIL